MKSFDILLEQLLLYPYYIMLNFLSNILIIINKIIQIDRLFFWLFVVQIDKNISALLDASTIVSYLKSESLVNSPSKVAPWSDFIRSV